MVDTEYTLDDKVLRKPPADAVAALAEALHATDVSHPSKSRWPNDGCVWCEEDAAAILDRLPPGWCGHEAEVEGYYRLLDAGVAKQARLEDAEATIARLRKIEEAARAFVDFWEGPPYVSDDGEISDQVDLLRAALSEADHER